MNSRKLTASAAALILPVAAALAVLLLMPVIRVSAHADYDHSTPADGEVVATAPAKIDVYFKESITRANGLPLLIVLNDTGDPVDTGTFAAPSGTLDDNDRTHMSDTLQANLPDGRYTVIWHTVSADDGAEAQGAFHFYIGGAVTPIPTAAPGSATPVPSIPAVTPAPSSSSSSDIPIWGLIVGIVGGIVVGGGGGLLFARRANS
ncbi:MAG TPA: copper resistance protein CopC [Dehalococcoidia bacterium]